MNTGFKYRILVVDDDETMLETSKTVLEGKGYEVRTARDGFEALIELRQAQPNIIISDLSMPNMSGFELLSVVRKRFPQIGVIAISGEYAGGSGGLIADAFFTKGGYRPEELFEKVAMLISGGPLRSGVLPRGHAPSWTPLNSDGYHIVTCNECLRSFPVAAQDAEGDLRDTECAYCGVRLTFLAQRSRSVLHEKQRPSRTTQAGSVPAGRARQSSNQ